MSTTESLCLSLDNANGEIQRLEAENRRLRDAHPEQAAETDLLTKMQQLKELYQQALGDIQRKDEQVDEIMSQLEETTESLQSQEKTAQEAQSKCQSLEESLGVILEQVTQVRDAEEPKRHHTVDAKRSKWEEREARLVAQLKAASGQMELRGTPAPESTDHTDQPTLTSTQVPAEVALPRRSAAEVVRATEPESTPRSTGSSLVSAAAGTEPSTVAGHAMLANQVPHLVAFSGEEKDP